MAALEVLLDRYETPLFNFILRFVRDQERAKDLLQEVLLRLVQSADGFRGQAKLRTWLYRIARNQCIDHSRRQKHRRHASLDAESGEHGGSLHDRVASTASDGESGTGDRQLGVRIAAAVDELPEDQREVFVMRHAQHLSFREIAEVVGIPENTAKSRMRYALERLQAALADFRQVQGGAG
jgi:RNA polymerase sigma-70 factor (ECF subfamily)